MQGRGRDDIPMGRAHGRARGIRPPPTSDVPPRAGVPGGRGTAQRPGTATPDAQAVLLGRGLPGRGSSETPGILTGRCKPRVAQASATVRSVSTGLASVSLSSSASDLSGSNSNGNGSSGNGNGSGSPNGNGDDPGQSVGRGAKRGRPADSRILRTKPDTISEKKGDMGQAVNLKANYFKFKKLPNWRLFQYRVDMNPEVDYTKERKYYLRNHKELKNYFFDGTMLITNHPITGSKDDHYTFLTKRSSDDQEIMVTIRLVGEVDPSTNTYIQFLNIILRCVLEKLDLEQINRNFYDTKAAIKDPKLRERKLELYPGYITSIRQQENDVLLNVEISHKVLRIDSVLDVMNDVIKKARSRADLQADLDKALLGQIVITKYNMKTYRIHEVRLDLSPSLEFEDSKGNKKNFITYYRERWNMNIRDTKQPMIISIPKERDQKGMKQGPVQLVPELCNMTGLSDAQRADFRLMSDVAVYTRMDPKQKEKALMAFAKRIHDNPEIKAVLDQWDMEFENSLVDVEGRQLVPEQIIGGGNSTATYPASNADWGNCFRNWKCRTSASLKKWVCIVPERDEVNTKELITLLMKIFPTIGMSVAQPKMHVIKDNRMPSYRQAVEDYQAKKPELIMVILPNVNEELYAMVKRQCYVQSPVASQIVTGRVISKPKGLMSVATKIALQMNCKLGGQLWAVKIPLNGAMMVGYDAYHDSKQKGKSVGALIASLNKECTQYFSTAEYHDASGAQEITDKIGLMMIKALEAYQTANKAVPDRIFFYRDGVGEGQIPHVFNTEVAAIKKAIALINPNIMLTFVITSKRISARFMTAQGKINPYSGTVVDDVVTNPERYDFYLVSQSVRQGTVNPTSYNVIHDENKLPPGKMQMLTYKLTHLYFNWPGTVRVPAMVQYAHKLAYLTGTSLHAKPHADLEKELFYL
jgi:aubergine-like protein